MINDDYEQANWAKLSPQFRDAHNRRRIVNGYSPLPEPRISLYTGPKGLSDADRRRFNIPSILKIDDIPRDLMPLPVGRDEGA